MVAREDVSQASQNGSFRECTPSNRHSSLPGNSGSFRRKLSRVDDVHLLELKGCSFRYWSTESASRLSLGRASASAIDLRP